MKQDELKKLYELSIKKKDGIYSYAGRYHYAVKECFPILIGDRITGEVAQIFGCFLVRIGGTVGYKVRSEIVRLFKDIQNDQ